ncbi:unnamed protein product [Hyaloperonospora brassicae]|uniref:Ribosome assembly protein 3 n=1 Tax=Hyaloperonospora brassicae TaxID=162125 RepID=A0AAV0T914_HYABA|nr:unnamed protein product [Hyaloperonospora brassicae]
MDDEGGDGGRLAARYDRLIAALSRNAFASTRGDDAFPFAVAVAEAETSEAHGQQLLARTAATSVRCAELIAASLETSGALVKLEKTLQRAHACSGEGDEREKDEAMDCEEKDRSGDGEGDGDEEATTLLLQDLVAAGDEAADAATTYVQLGVVRKTARASRALLASAETHLQKHWMARGDAPAVGATAVANEFRQLYMEEFTAAFGDELDQFRQEDRFESKDVTYLISCIQAGGDIFTPLQKQLFMDSVRTCRE